MDRKQIKTPQRATETARKGGVMVKLDIDIPASCKSCPFKGARVCYIATWLGTEYREVPEEGRPSWCPLIDLTDDGR